LPKGDRWVPGRSNGLFRWAVVSLLAAAPCVAVQQAQPLSDPVIRQLVAERLHGDEKLGSFAIENNITAVIP
jgi:hypothetical protein